MLNRSSFFFKQNTAIPILLIGKAGKTIVKTLLKSIFKDTFIFFKLDSHLSNIEQILYLRNKAQKLNRPYLVDIEIEKFHRTNKILEHVEFQVVIVTNIGNTHLAYKKERHGLAFRIENLLENLPKNCVVILNKDDDFVSDFVYKLKTQQVIKYGFNTNSDFYASKIEQKGQHGLFFLLNNRLHFSARIFQFYHVYNILIAIVVARLLDIKFEEIANRISGDYVLPSGRCNLLTIHSFKLLNDTSSHSFQSITSAAQTLVTFKNYSNKMIMVIGDLPGNREKLKQLHINLGHFLSSLPIDIILTFGEYSQYIHEGINLVPNNSRIQIHSESIYELVMNLQLFIEKNDTILLKAKYDSGITIFIDILKYIVESDK